MFFRPNKALVTMKSIKALPMLLLFLTFSGVNSSLTDSVCKSSLWNSITEAMTKTSNPSARSLVNARIDCCESNREKGGWCGNSHSTDNWIEVDFDQGVGIRGLVIQKPEDAHAGYVTSVSLQFMLKESTSWQYVSSDPTQPQPIDALKDNKTVSTTITINPGLVVTKFRINILQYQKSPCLRFDLLGCNNYEALCPNTCLNGGQCLAENMCACPNNYNGARCEKMISNPVCDTALGLASGAIPDSMISVSSSASGKPKDKVRYNCCAGEENGAWCPASSDHQPWLEVRLSKPMAVSGLKFRHPSQKDSHTYPSMYMETFELKFISVMDPIREWRSFHEHTPSIYNSTLYYNIGLNPYIVTDTIRIYPETYHRAACFRMEVVGCDPAGLCSRDFCKNGGICIGVNVCKCPSGFYGDSCDKQTTNMVQLNLGFTQIIQNVIHTSLQTTFNIHGTATPVISDIGKAINLTGNSYITVNNTGFNACVKDIDTCSSGFTLSFNVNLHQLTDNTYIISSGGDLQNHKGIALFYQNNKLYFIVTTSSKQWIVSVPNTLSLNVWHKIELSWSKPSGSLLVIDNNLAGSVSQPQPTVARQILPLTIGHGYHHQVSISMTVSGVQTFDSHRENLLINGLVIAPTSTMAQQTTPTANPTTKTDQTTIASCDQQTLDFTFNKIERNVLITPSYNFTVHGNPSLMSEQNGKAILELQRDGQFVELPNYGLECIQDMTKCDHGFTLSVEIKLKDMNSTDKRYILSSGGDQVGASGLAVYLWHGDLYCSTKKDNILWTTKHKLDVSAGEWHIYQVSWNKKDGFIVYLDGKVFMSHSIILPNPAQPTVYPLYIANAPYSTYSSTQMDVRNLYTWSASRDSLIGQGCITEYSTVPQISSTPSSKISVTISTAPGTTPVQSTSDTTKWTMLLMMSSNKPSVLISTNMTKNITNDTKTTERSDISCNAENIEIFLPKNLLPVSSRVTWLDPNCNIASNGTHYVSTVKHGECGTTVSLTANNVIFENEIKAKPLSPENHLLDFGTNPYVIPVKCIYPRKEMTLSSYQPVKQQVRVYEKRFGHLDIDMRQYETNQFNRVLDNSTIPKLELNSYSFIKVGLQNFGSANLGIHLDTCIATKTPTPYDSVFIKLIENGCPKVNFVHLLPSSSLEARFSLRAFEFMSGRSNVVYIHCQASVCLANSSQCNPDCSTSHRTKRDVSSPSSHLLSMGPLVLAVDRTPSSSLIANTIAGVSVAVAVVAIVIAAKGWRKKTTIVVNDKRLDKIDS